MNRKRSLVFFFSLCFLTALAFVFQKEKAEAPIQVKKEIPEETKRADTGINNEEKVVIDQKKSIEKVEDPALPAKVSISVPFTSQAPFSVWDEYHEEACEEASLLMVQYFLQKKALNREVAESEIQKMIAFQIKNYGDYMDSDAQEIVKLGSDFYGLDRLKVVYDFSKEDLKKELAKGNPVIVPAAGRLLGNPNFTPPGPLYHALVLKGYDGNTVITNDPGTRKGEGYRYDINVLFSAIHDFPGDKNKINSGRKAMIVVEAKN